MPRTSNGRAPIPNSRRALERLLTADEVAEFLGIPISTLYQWRHRGRGPRLTASDGTSATTHHSSSLARRSPGGTIMAWVERRDRTSSDGKRTITCRVRWRESDWRARAKTFRTAEPIIASCNRGPSQGGHRS